MSGFFVLDKATKIPGGFGLKFSARRGPISRRVLKFWAEINLKLKWEKILYENFYLKSFITLFWAQILSAFILENRSKNSTSIWIYNFKEENYSIVEFQKGWVGPNFLAFGFGWFEHQVQKSRAGSGRHFESDEQV